MSENSFLTGYRTRLSHAADMQPVGIHPWSTWILAVVVASTAVWIVASIMLVPGDETAHFHFVDERGAVTALSALFLAAGSAFALVAFLVRHDRVANATSLFWLVAAGGLAVLALDELLQFHERVGGVLDSNPGSQTTLFRNWNDIIVIGYGVIAVGVGLVFLPVVMSYRHLLPLLATAFCFFAVHTAVDSLADPPTTMSVIIEESAKLFTGAFILLAMLQGMLQSVAHSAYNSSATPASISDATHRTNNG